VCRKIITFDFLGALIAGGIEASIEYGGWYCGYHTKEELENVKSEFLYLDRFGDPCAKDTVYPD